LFAREARITSLLQHPNIVQVIDHNTTADGTEYLVMEYLAGESLAQRLSKQVPLPLDTVVGIVDQIAAGLAAAHARGVVHRDLKPDNVFLVPVEGRATALVKLLDFGISKATWTRETSNQTICGTPQYMAPEQAEGRTRDVDAATDQYALAVIAHELLTGENPFAAESITAVLQRVLGGIVPPTGLSQALDAVLARALSPRNGDRFASVTAFAEAFRAAVPGEVVPGEVVPAEVAPAEPVPATRARRTRTRGRGGGVWLGFAAAAIVCASVLGTGATKRAPAPPAVARVAPAATVAPAASVVVEAVKAETESDAIVPA